MSENLDPVRTNLISAAAMLAGPGAAQQAISDNVIALAVMARDGSPVMERLDRVLDAQMFVSTITSVEREPSSTRDIVHFRGRPTDEHPEGQTESIRTERTDNAEGAAMSVMARRMIGHRVVCYKVFDTITRKGQTQKVRILGWLTDLGLSDGATGVGVDPTVPQGRAEADSGPAPSRVAHEVLTHDQLGPVQYVKEGPSPEQIRAARLNDPLPPEPSGEDWKRDESAVAAGSPTEQRNRILELAQHIGRADARDLASAAVGYDVSTLIVPELRSAADAAKVITALQNAWNDLQVQRKQAAS
jgi:hypothetical protein